MLYFKTEIVKITLKSSFSLCAESLCTLSQNCLIILLSPSDFLSARMFNRRRLLNIGPANR